LEELLRHSWPGNVRELEHVVERALIRSQGKKKLTFEICDAPQPKNFSAEQESFFAGWPSLEEMENRYIREVLAYCRGKLTGRDSASTILGIHYTTLRARMRRLGVADRRDEHDPVSGNAD
jgi:DNA-binding NtrC family response regulator